MACDVTMGRLESCKDSISGLLNIYFANYGDLASETAVYGAAEFTDQIATWDPVGATALNLYKYELKGANGFEQTIQTSRDNGTTFYEQVLTVQLKTQNAATTKQVKLLAAGRPRVIVETRNHQFFLVGLDQGADLTAGSISSGTAMGDFNGYNLTFTAMEKLPANFINCTTETQLKTVFTNGALPAVVVTA
jgi:hypothetical protein